MELSFDRKQLQNFLYKNRPYWKTLDSNNVKLNNGDVVRHVQTNTPDNKEMNRSSNDTRALGLGNTRQTLANTTNAVISDVIRLDANELESVYLAEWQP